MFYQKDDFGIWTQPTYYGKKAEPLSVTFTMITLGSSAFLN
jgi:hypothetical protein